ncbi:MAG: MFS transporter [Tissierellales bacterium]|jgi:fucose permease|nr:MFS transporter [Tissierellales bacterium]
MSQNENKMTYGWCIVLIIGFMLLLAAMDSLRGVFIPVFKEVFNVKNTQMGFLLTASSLGYILGTYVSGHLCDLFGQKKLIVIGGLLVVASIPLVTLGGSYAMLLCALLLMNVGASFIALGINTMVPLILVSFQSVLMNFVHFAYGFGSMMTQYSAGDLIYRGISWQSIYVFIGIYAFVLCMLSLIIKMPRAERAGAENEGSHAQIFKMPVLYIYSACLGFYVAAEMCTGNWMINYLKDGFTFNQKDAAFYSALFFGCLTVGRLIGGAITERFGYIKTVSVFLGINAILFPISMMLGANGVYLIAMTGFFCSIVFPTIVLSLSHVFKSKASYVTGIVVTFASATAMFANIIIGFVNDLFGVEAGFGLIGAFYVMSFIMAITLLKKVGSIIETSRKK